MRVCFSIYCQMRSGKVAEREEIHFARFGKHLPIVRTGFFFRPQRGYCLLG